MQKNLILVLVLAIIIGVFALSNADKVEIDFVFTKVELSQAIVIFISALLGAALATIFGFARELKTGKELKELTKQINVLTDERHNLEKQIQEINDSQQYTQPEEHTSYETFENVDENDFSGN